MLSEDELYDKKVQLEREVEGLQQELNRIKNLKGRLKKNQRK
jgi:hypothetical protein